MTTTHLSRRSLLAAGLSAAGLPGAPAILKGAARKRNFLFITSDDLCNRLGCYGYQVKTPNIDRLAQSGVRFDRAYCQYSLCSPSRTSVLTGYAPDKTRVWDLQTHFRSTLGGVMTLPQAFKANGYFAGRAGKIYHYNVPSEIGTPGFDDPPSWDQTANPAGLDRTRDQAFVTIVGRSPARSGALGAGEAGGLPGAGGRAPAAGRGAQGGIRLAQDGKTPVLPMPNGDLGATLCWYPSPAQDHEITDYLVADAVIDMMQKHRNDSWFLGAGFFMPHVAWIVPSKYFDLYKLEDMDIPPYDPKETAGPPKQQPRLATPMTEKEHRELIRAYYAATSFMDAQVGRLTDALNRLGLARDTTVVFWGDNGYMLGEHGRWQKGGLFEPSARVPLIMAGAGIASAGKACPRTVESLDIYPTAVELCGLKGTPHDLHGRSLAPLLQNPNAPWDRPAITQTGHGSSGGYSIRTESYRYSLYADGAGGEELYDYEADPRETTNRADDPALRGIKAELRTRLEQICKQRGKT